MNNGFSWKAFFRFPRLRVWPKAPHVFSEENYICGRVIRAAACEFLAETELGEIRGRLADAESEPEAGAPVRILVRSRDLRLSECPPEENAFRGRVVGCARRGDSHEVLFVSDSGRELCVSSNEAPPECGEGEALYAWVFPEDVLQS